MSFREAEALLKFLLKNNTELEEICNVMNVILENGYFDVISTMGGHVIDFQDKVKKMLLEAQKIKDQTNIKPTVQQKTSFDMSDYLLNILLKNNTELEEICNVMNVTLEDGYFNVITTMCGHVVEFQAKVKKMLLEAQKNKEQTNTKPNVQQKKNQKRSKNKKQNNHKTKTPKKSQIKTRSNFESTPKSKIQSDPDLEIQSDPILEIQSDSILEIQSDHILENKSDPILEIKSEPKLTAREKLFSMDWY